MAAVREGVLSREIAVLLAELGESRDELARLKGDAARAAEETAGLRLQLSIAREAVRALQDALDAMRRSRSWRITSPIRVVSNLARRIAGRPLAPLAPALRSGFAGEVASPEPADAPMPSLPAPASQVGRRRRVFVAADFLPLFDQQSGGRRLNEIIRLLGEIGWDVVFLSMCPEDNLPGVLGQPEGRLRYENSLRAGGVTHILYGLEQARRYLDEAGREIDCAILSFPAIATEMLPLVRAYCPTSRIIFDMVDFHGLRMSREAALLKDPTLADEAARQQALELACAKAADVTFAVTSEERAALLQLVPNAVVEVMPNIFDVPERPLPGPEGRTGLLFVGGFWHKPNGDAMLWFVEKIWPLVRQRAPATRLTIVGSYPSDEVLALGQQPGIEVLGYVADLSAEFDRHRAFVAPLRYGAGMKGKVGESLINGLPVVATSVGAEGMGLQPGANILVADTEAEFAEQVLRLLQDDRLWGRLAAKGRQHIIDTLSRDVIGARLRTILNG
jgi:hypothetical protein